MKWNPKKQFLLTMITFAILGAAFKVMVLVEGLTEVRPANAIPMIAGLAFGPVGALGCACGNLAADLFGTFDWTSALGFAGNFMAAYLPYRMWHLLSGESPNVHTWRNLALYAWLSLISALTVAWLLGFGLECFFGLWIASIYRYVFLNNFGFSLALGLPLFIVLTSDGIRLSMRDAPRAAKRFRWPKDGRAVSFVAVLYTLCMLFILTGVLTGLHLTNSVSMKILSVLCILLLLCLCAVSAVEEGV